MEIRVIHAGMQTTVQDLGRKGHLAQGVSIGGAVDPIALRLANLLVGNAEDLPALEITLTAPELEFEKDGWIAVCGARFEGVSSWRPIRVYEGDRLKFGSRVQGCRAYLSICGGFDVEPIMGGRGTFLPAAFGGFEGRALRDGDLIHSVPSERVLTGHWSIDERVLPRYSREPTVSVIAGSQAGEFGDAFYAERFAVTARSNRMGIRLEGPALTRTSGTELISSAVAPGTVQVPPDGNPIVLMADAQTLGGYPRIAHVALADIPLLAQLAPGDGVRFKRITVAEAHALARAEERGLALLRQGLAEKIRSA
jgi:antagonist of KipI